MQVNSTPDAPKAIGPYVQAIASDDWLFTSGQITLAADGSRVEIEALARRLR